jgi:hypothetical protein
MARSSRAFLLLSLCCMIGCAVSVTRDGKSTYQDALEAYYTVLFAEDVPSAAQMDSVLTGVDKILAKNPHDVDTRMLRAQIYLFLYRASPDSAAVADQLVKELRRLSLAVASADRLAAWVEPRLYITMGDLLTLRGTALVGNVVDSRLGDGGADGSSLWEAWLHFGAAAQYYAYAQYIADRSDESQGAVRESGHALMGYIQAQRGIVESISLIDPESKNDGVYGRKLATLDELEVVLQTNRVTAPAASQVSFDPMAHQDAGEVYELLASELLRTIKLVCEDATLTAEEKAWKIEAPGDDRRVALEQAAMHGLLKTVLDPGGGDWPLSKYLPRLQKEYERKTCADY